MSNHIAVGLAEIKISNDPNDVLVAFGLGSCLGIGMYDPMLKLGGLLHAVLPKAGNHTEELSAKYVDTGIRLLLNQLTQLGALPARLKVRMVGGANILVAPSLSSTFDIGARNISAAYQVFKELGIKLISEEVGGQTGRTVRMYILDGRMTIRVMGGQEREV